MNNSINKTPLNPTNDDQQPQQQNNQQRESLEVDNIAEFQKKMNEANKQGWFPIHEAAYRGYVNGVKRLIDHSKDKQSQLELETKDDLQATPILIAALGSNLDVIKLLYELGARIDSKNAHEHGLIEIASLRQDLKLIEYLLNLPESGINVWKRLLQIFTIDSEEISGSVGRTIEKLIEIPVDKNDQSKMNNWKKNIKNFIDNGLTGILCKVLQQRNKETLISAFIITLNLIDYVENEKLYDLTKQLIKGNILQILMPLLKIDAPGQTIDLDILCLCGKVFDRLSNTNEILQNTFALTNDLTQNLYQNVLKIIQKIHSPIVLFSYLDFITNLLKYGKSSNIQLQNLPSLVSALIILYRDCNSDFYLFRSLLRLTVALSLDSNDLQTQFVKEGLTVYLGMALKQGSVELKELSITCIEIISKTNVFVQKILAKDSILVTLLTLLSKSQSHQQKVLTANALWSLAGDDPIQRKYMALKIRVPVLTDFLQMKSDDLYFIASDALRVLFFQPPNKNASMHDQFLDLHGINALVRVLTSEKEHIVLAVIRCIQRLCVRSGLIAHKHAQEEVQKYNGITFLVALLIHAKQEIIKVEAALALSYLCLDNQRNLEITLDTLDFNYGFIYKLIKSKSTNIQLLALSSLSIFAFNNLPQQRSMAIISTLPYSYFENNLISKDDFDKCEASFQLIVLSNLVVGTQQATASAKGIKILIDLLNNSQINDRIKITAAEKLALLGRLKNGVSDAIIAVEGINVLCNNCYTDNENLQGTCAIALSIFSYINEGRRKLLNRCRHDPSLIDVLKFYNDYKNSKHCLSGQFNQDWQHYKNVGLPNAKKLVGVQDRVKIAAEVAPVNKSVKFTTQTSSENNQNNNQKSIEFEEETANEDKEVNEELENILENIENDNEIENNQNEVLIEE